MNKRPYSDLALRYFTVQTRLILVCCAIAHYPLFASDVDSYSVQKGIELTQSSSAIPTANSNNGYVFEAAVQAHATNSVTAATVLPPGGTAKTLTPDTSNQQFKYKKKYDTLVKLNNGAPTGNYLLNIATVHDGLKNLSVALSSDVYPASAHLLNFDAAQNLDAGTYFIFKWEYLGDGPSPDFVQLRIENSNGDKVFETPDSGQDALNGSFTSFLFQRSVLSPNQTYQATLLTRRQIFSDTASYSGADGVAFLYRRVSFTVKTSLIASAADVKQYFVQKTTLFNQTLTSGPAAIENNGDIFHAQIDASASNSVSAVVLTFPNQNTTNILASDPKRLEFESKLDTQLQLDATFPNGSYVFRVTTQNQQTKAVGIPLTGDLYPPPPTFTNLSAAQNIDPAQDFTLEWQSFTGAGSLDFIHLQIEDEAGNKVMETGDFAKSGALSPFRTSQKIQDGTLLPGTSYTAKLLFMKVTAIDTTTYPGALGVSGYARETHAHIQTTGAVPRPPALVVTGSTSQGLKITLTGTVGATYRIEASPNFQHWLTFATITLNDTHADWIDTSAPAIPYRFYRAVQN